jgi:hypothetical protein
MELSFNVSLYIIKKYIDSYIIPSLCLSIPVLPSGRVKG